VKCLGTQFSAALPTIISVSIDRGSQVCDNLDLIPGVEMDMNSLAALPMPASDPSTIVSSAGPLIRPAERILLWSSDEWETFIREWATTFASEYQSVRHFGGAGDKGIDVAGFESALGFEGTWDAFQAKHYDHALTPGDAFPEIAKFLRNLRSDELTMPRAYYFVAPRGCGTTLARELKRPEKLKTHFLEWLDGHSADFDDSAEVRASAEGLDFSLFTDLSPDEMIERHKLSPYHFARFGGQLPPRGANEPLPAEVSILELRYVEQLVDVYDHEWPEEGITSENVSSHAKSSKPFLRQRLRFYSAESLARYARDEVPVGTFERLQADILSGVIDTAELPHPTPLGRMNAVFELVSSMELSSHALIAVTSHDDRRGICHQLANSDELTWKP
jgi:hypothetical protein